LCVHYTVPNAGKMWQKIGIMLLTLGELSQQIDIGCTAWHWLAQLGVHV